MVIRFTDLGTGLFGSHVDLNDIAEAFSEAYSTSLSFGQNTKIIRIGKGSGYCSIVARIEADWIGNSTEDVPREFIVKITAYLKTIDDNLQISEDREWAETATNHEITFYQLAKKYDWKLPVPEMIAYKKFTPPENRTKGFIAMRYCAGEKSLSRFDYLRLEEMEQVVRGFAAIHSASATPIVSQEDERYCREQECPDEDDLSQLMDLRDWGISSELMDRVEKILPDLKRRKSEIREDGNRDIVRVLVHCDAWSSNVLMSGEKHGERKFQRIIDFQYFHMCNPVEDLIPIITTCAPFNIRREHTERLLRVYYEEMQKRLEIVPFTFAFEQLRYSFDKLFVHYATKVVFLYRAQQCVGDEWKMQRAKEKIEGILEEALTYYENVLAPQ